MGSSKEPILVNTNIKLGYIIVPALFLIFHIAGWHCSMDSIVVHLQEPLPHCQRRGFNPDLRCFSTNGKLFSLLQPHCLTKVDCSMQTMPAFLHTQRLSSKPLPIQ